MKAVPRATGRPAGQGGGDAESAVEAERLLGLLAVGSAVEAESLDCLRLAAAA